MRILFACGRELEYPRNDVLRRAFQRLGSVTLTGDSGSGSLLRRSLRVFLRTAPRLLTQPFDLVCVGFYGHLLMLLLRGLTRRPILFDAFLSTYDTLVLDRRTFAPGSLQGRLAFQLDLVACRWSQHILLDTPPHVDYFAETFGVPAGKLTSLPVGCNEDLFAPRPGPVAGPVTILYYSSFLPLHGADTVVRAAALLRREAHLHFRLIGQGQEYDRVRRLAESLALDNLTFVPPMPLHELPGEIAAAHVCLGGHFGQSAKAGRVIPGKIYQMLAMAQPVIAADTLANRQLLTHMATAYLCPPGDPAALAAGVVELYQNTALRRQLANAGRSLYEACCSEAVITQRVGQLVQALAG